MPKTLIFCFDGTCNDPQDAGDWREDESITNICKLHALFGGSLDNKATLSLDNKETQHSFYYSGVGTYGGAMQRLFNMALAPEQGDVGRIIKTALGDLKKARRPSDRVLAFGFSRGAALARRFASLLAKEKIAIKFLGVFDTVASIGRPDLDPSTRPASDVLFEDETMAATVEQAVHLVALDEERLAFQPTLFNQDKRVLEAWFPGAHADVGGGFFHDGLSNIALEFMLKEVESRCAGIVRWLNPNYEDSLIRYDMLKDEAGTKIVSDDLTITPIAKGVMHKKNRGGVGRATLRPRELCVHRKDKPCNIAPILHHSVRERFMRMPDYRPFPLRGKAYRILELGGKLTKETGIEGLRRSAAKLAAEQSPSAV